MSPRLGLMEDTSPVSFPGPAGEAGLGWVCVVPLLWSVQPESLSWLSVSHKRPSGLCWCHSHPRGTRQAQPPSPKVALSHLSSSLRGFSLSLSLGSCISSSLSPSPAATADPQGSFRG